MSVDHAISITTAELRREQREATERAAHAAAIARHPDCAACVAGKGTIVTGPGHSDVHAGHCSCDRCW